MAIFGFSELLGLQPNDAAETGYGVDYSIEAVMKSSHLKDITFSLFQNSTRKLRIAKEFMILWPYASSSAC